MTAHLQDQPWLTSAATRAVFAALEAAGGPDCARFVGGSVRNALLGQAVADIDIATTLEPEVAFAAIRKAGLKAVPTGLAHGTVTAVSGHKPYEITTLRRDVTTDGRKATVAFTDDWSEDAARRDFRLNALYADLSGRIYDPTGEGVADALAGRVIFVGDPVTRIREDYLRILRFFRFYAWYGRDVPDAAAMAACTAEVEGLACLSAERVSTELMTLLAAPDPRRAVQAMAATGVLAQLLPEAVAGAVFQRLCEITTDPVVRLAGLVPVGADGLRTLAAELRLSNAVRDRLVAGAEAATAVRPDMSDQAARAAVYRLGPRAVQDALVQQRASVASDPADDVRLAALIAGWTVPVLPVGGRDLARLGVVPGPETGRLLKAFEAGWIADDFPADGHEARLRALLDPAFSPPPG
ncbi:CCA tRNA nucleotidyltransferase [uncultured Brevundimonas sp.]|uniref:CCA tRNA nucleotidyltransferase n=1 Tax=uncultured Brevundimonas sp. TaxID=213418 RepID=UPI0030ED838D|tara:strand:- start:167775 stop:169007 length:1233 start_codon:yes stop_codon:yes gene_type:complete